MAHLAQINIARLVAPKDDPKIAEFVAELEPLNAMAEAAPAFVWRLLSATDEGEAADPLELLNLSVWQSVEALREYVYNSRHLDVFRKRANWFERVDKPNYCLWWIPEGHVPTVAEGRERLAHYQMHGATEKAFSFAQPFPAPDYRASSVCG